MDDVKAKLLSILQQADLNSLSERGVRERLAETFSWGSAELEQHKAMIKAEIESFLEQHMQGGNDAAEQQMQGSQMALGKRKAAAPPGMDPPAKVAKTTNDEGEAILALSDDRRVTVRLFKGKPCVDIREFYEKDGQLLPGRKGLQLTPAHWAGVKGSTAAVAEALEGGDEGLSVDLGNMRYLRVRQVGSSLCVDLREHYDKDGQPAPGKKGISLQVEQWVALTAAAADIDAALADLPAAASEAPASKTEAAAAPAAAGPSSSKQGAAKSGSKAAAAAASAAEDAAAEGSDGLPIMLSSVRRADVSNYQGKTYVNIREYYKDKTDGLVKPGAKGIALLPEQFLAVKGAVDDISAALQSKDAAYRLPLSSKRAVRISEYKGAHMIDIREMYEKDGEQLPGKKGISLVAAQWEALVRGLPALEAALP